MQCTEKLDIHRKALTLNLDPSKFGSFAEIGGGQEVARWFLAVGGASGTVAKTISAYYKEVSASLYGTGSRYVSRQRLEAILETECALSCSGNWTRPADQTRTSSPLSILFPREPSPEQTIRMAGLDFGSSPIRAEHLATFSCTSTCRTAPTFSNQQEAIGILGVNLIYAAFYQLQNQENASSTI